MTPSRLAFIAGEVWLASGIARRPTANDLAMIANGLDATADSLAVVKECVPVAEAVSWVLEGRSSRAVVINDVPRW